MEKPKTIIWNDGSEIPLKDFCQHFKAEFAFINDVKYRLPEGWNHEKEEAKETNRT